MRDDHSNDDDNSDQELSLTDPSFIDRLLLLRPPQPHHSDTRTFSRSRADHTERPNRVRNTIKAFVLGTATGGAVAGGAVALEHTTRPDPPPDIRTFDPNLTRVTRGATLEQHVQADRSDVPGGWDVNAPHGSVPSDGDATIYAGVVEERRGDNDSCVRGYVHGVVNTVPHNQYGTPGVANLAPDSVTVDLTAQAGPLFTSDAHRLAEGPDPAPWRAKDGGVTAVTKCVPEDRLQGKGALRVDASLGVAIQASEGSFTTWGHRSVAVTVPNGDLDGMHRDYVPQPATDGRPSASSGVQELDALALAAASSDGVGVAESAAVQRCGGNPAAEPEDLVRTVEADRRGVQAGVAPAGSVHL
jgi:hypothetical protein